MTDESIETMAGANNQPADTSSSENEQNPLFGIGAGVLAMIAGTALWIMIAQKFKMSGFSVAIAFGIASAIKYAGKTKELWYGIVGAVLSLIAAFAGNYATVTFLYARKFKKTPLEALSAMTFTEALTYMRYLAGFFGIVIYLLTIYIGFWYAFEHRKKKNPYAPE